MITMINSEQDRNGGVHRFAGDGAAIRQWPGLLLSTLLAAASFAPAGAADSSVFAERAFRSYEKCRLRLQADATNTVAGWQFARACFEWAEFATNDTQRAGLAERGIAVTRDVIGREPNLGAAHYYLAMNLGQSARTKILGALSLVEEMETEYKLARILDPKLDFTGPARSLGLLYVDAPGWPVSIGSNGKARTLLREAVKGSPDFPENRFCLIETYQKWNERTNAAAEVKATAVLLPAARKKYSGEEWESSWADWEIRWRKITNAITGPGPAAPKAEK